MPIQHSYAQHGDACAAAHALEVLGARWTYPVLREVLLGPKRFGELAMAVRGITPAVLTARLREMETNGLIARRQLPLPGNVVVYEATEWARHAAPTFASLARWAQHSPTYADDGGLTPDAAVQSMLAMAPVRALTPAVEIGLNLFDARLPDGDQTVGYDYRVRWADTLTIERKLGTRWAAASSGAITRVRADSSAWTRILYEGRSLDAAAIEGSRRDVTRIVAPFRALKVT